MRLRSEKMRVVVISRSYIPRVNREKLKKLAEKGIDLYLITPKEWKNKLKKYSLKTDSAKIKATQGNKKLKGIKVTLNDHKNKAF